jgi:CPA1 family monovalent cation:H+ antiporter
LSALDYFAVLVAVTAGCAYLNHHLVRLPRNTGLLVVALIATLALRVVAEVFPHVGLAEALRAKLDRAHPGDLLLNGVLGFLLFAGAMEIEVKALLAHRWTILFLATIGVLLSTVLMGGGMYVAFRLVGIDVPWAYCLAFGALISPTDPVSVLKTLDRESVPQRIRAIVAGESLFNDGIGIVLFALFLGEAMYPQAGGYSVVAMTLEFFRAAGGGVALGLALGGAAVLVTRSIDEYNVELLISLAVAAGTYGIARDLDISGPVAVVTAGLLMGSIGRRAVSDTTQTYIRRFWSVTEEILNSFLFLLIGLELSVVELEIPYLIAAAVAIPLALVVRGLSILAASLPLRIDPRRHMRGVALLTWSGLRGAISIALALSLPASPYREALVTACYGVAVFTMLVQGLSLGKVASRLYPSHDR